MNTPIIILFLACAVAYSYAAVERYRAEPKPAEFADQEGCYLSSLNRVLPYDTPYSPENDDKCEQYICSRNNETQRETCGVVAVSENCKATYNNQLKYPECCKATIVCDQTTVAPTTEVPTTVVPTTVVPTTVAPTTEAASTTPTPPPPQPQSSYASAYASSQPGSPPVAQASATPGASAAASAS